jgi:hypothetical protein
LEERIREELRLLHDPYLELREDGVPMAELEELVRSCRDAVNAGELRTAALSLNAAAELVQRLLSFPEGEQPGMRRPASPPADSQPD